MKFSKEKVAAWLRTLPAVAVGTAASLRQQGEFALRTAEVIQRGLGLYETIRDGTKSGKVRLHIEPDPVTGKPSVRLHVGPEGK